jgi:hypothetical protein
MIGLASTFYDTSASSATWYPPFETHRFAMLLRVRFISSW